MSCLHADRQTNMAKLTDAFLQLFIANVPEMWYKGISIQITLHLYITENIKPSTIIKSLSKFRKVTYVYS